MKNLFKNSAILLGIVIAAAFTLNVVSGNQNTSVLSDQSEIAMASVTGMNVFDSGKCNDGKDMKKHEKSDKKDSEAKSKKDAKCGNGDSKCGDGKCGKDSKESKKSEKKEKDKEMKCGDGKCGS